MVTGHRLVKVIELDTSEELSEKALAEALRRVEGEPHDGWADLIVHQANIVRAARLVTRHNGHDPMLRLRAMCETRMGREDWRLKTRSVEVRVQWEKV